MRGKKFWSILLLKHMLCFGKHGGVTKKVLAMMLLAAVTAFGAGWDSVPRVTEGQKIEVRTRDGAELKGTFISATAESIAIRYKSGEQSIERANVLRVRVYDAGRRTRKGAMWTAIGAGAEQGSAWRSAHTVQMKGMGHPMSGRVWRSERRWGRWDSCHRHTRRFMR